MISDFENATYEDPFIQGPPAGGLAQIMQGSIILAERGRKKKKGKKKEDSMT